jgi:site-specific DNA-methyltransferase (adenine-specific)
MGRPGVRRATEGRSDDADLRRCASSEIASKPSTEQIGHLVGDSRPPKPYYERAGITLYHGDSREIVPALPDGVADLIVTDPPYAVSKPGVGRWETRYGRTDDLDFFEGDSDWEGMTDTVRQVMRAAVAKLQPHGSIYAWVGHRQFGPLVADLEGAGWRTRFLVWEKECPVPPAPGSGWPSAAELCLYAYRLGRRWTPKGSRAVPPSNVLSADGYRHGQPGKVDHPTQKPPKVISPLVAVSSAPGDLVLDMFAGSGTTLRVAKDMGRRAIGIEIEERYCEIAAKRLSQDVLPLFDEAAS